MARGEEEASLALFEGKAGQVGKMTLLGHRSLEAAACGSVFLGDMRVASASTLFAFSPLLQPLSQRFGQRRAHPGDPKAGRPCKRGAFTFWFLQKWLIWFLQRALWHRPGVQVFQQKHTHVTQGALPWVLAPLPFSSGGRRGGLGSCWARGSAVSDRDSRKSWEGVALLARVPTAASASPARSVPKHEVSLSPPRLRTLTGQGGGVGLSEQQPGAPSGVPCPPHLRSSGRGRTRTPAPGSPRTLSVGS